MKKMVCNTIPMVIVLMFVSISACAEYAPILTDTWPICFYTGDVPDAYNDFNTEYDEWLQFYTDIYGGFYPIYTYPDDRWLYTYPDNPQDEFMASMSEEEMLAYVRENYQELIDDDVLFTSGSLQVTHSARRSLGEIKDVEYETITREYLIPLKDGKTAVLDTPDGYVFLGGEYDPGAIEHDGDPGIMDAVASEQSGWKADFYMENVCSVQRFCGDEDMGYYHINERYFWGDLVDKQKTVENLLILPIEDCRGMMATATQNWALEQAIQQSQAEGFEDEWQEWAEWNRKYGN